MSEESTELLGDDRPEGGVVVGDDGSEAADRALRFAVEEARRRGTTLHVVRAWSMANAVEPEGFPFGYVASEAELTAGTTAATEARVREALAGATDVAYDVRAVHGPPVKVMLDASKDADILVLGTRGRGGFTRLVLGSVADQCIRYGSVPVVVVR